MSRIFDQRIQTDPMRSLYSYKESFQTTGNFSTASTSFSMESSSQTEFCSTDIFFATTCSRNQGSQIFNGGMNQKYKRVINLTRLKAGTCVPRRAMGLVYFVLVSFVVFDWPALCNNCILHGPLQVTARSFFLCTRFLSAIILGALILSCISFIARKSMNAT